MNAAITVAAKTHCGRVRPINEDSYLVPEGDSLALVADGMGGHRAGEVASSMAAEAIRLSARKAAGRDISVKTAVSWVRQANRAIYRAANEDLSRSGMGTTLTFLYFMQGHVMLAHVGDSRCYLMRGGDVYQITKDHSLVAELVRKGEITEEEAIDREAMETKRHAPGFSGMFALDDYGSGYSNEGSLLELSPRFIKVDLTIIRGIDTDPDKQQIVQNIVAYAHPRSMQIIAEGVETAEELKKVLELGVDGLQGYFLAKPANIPTRIAPAARQIIENSHSSDCG